MFSLIPFSKAVNWSVHHLLDYDILHGARFPLFSIGAFLKRNKEVIEIQDTTIYKRVTIKLYGKGVFLRDELQGKAIGTKRQYVLSAGQFIVSKIDARNGAFGIIPDELAGAVTTADFVSFDIDTEKIVPQYLQLVVSTQRFSKMCQGQSSGTTGRQRISIDEFLDLQIPFPPLAEQKSIVDAFGKRKQQIEQKIMQINTLDDNINQYIASVLFTENRSDKPKNKLLSTISYKNLISWGNSKQTQRIYNQSFEAFPLLYFKAKILDISRGKSPVYDLKSQKVILNQKCNRWNFIDQSYAKTVKETWFSQIAASFLTQEGDILINSTGEGTIGRASVVRDSATGMLFDSHILRLRLNPDFMLPDFFVEIINSPRGQEQINSLKSAQTTKQTELGINNLLNFVIPKISIEQQQKILLNISDKRMTIKHLQAEVKKSQIRLQEDFELAIFN